MELKTPCTCRKRIKQGWEKIWKEFTGGIVKTLLFIGLVDVLLSGRCISGAFAASKLGLTTSRVQVPLSHVAIDGEEIPIPRRKGYGGKGWVLRNSKGQYTLTLDGLKAGSLERKTPALEIQGDLTLVLKKGTESELLSADAALKRGRYSYHTRRRKLKASGERRP